MKRVSNARCTCRSLKGAHCMTEEAVEACTINTPYEQKTLSIAFFTVLEVLFL